MKHTYIISSILGLAFCFAGASLSAQADCSDSPKAAPSRIVGDTKQPPLSPFPTIVRDGPPRSAERIVWWLHGLGGNEGAWQRAAAATEDSLAPGYSARKAFSYPLDYSQFMSAISSSAPLVKNKMENVSNAQGQTEAQRLSNILIAHSQGGIVGRYIDKLYDLPANAGERRFGGLVTFGTPHQGAVVFNNVMPDANGDSPITQFLEESCVELGAGPTAEIDAQIQSSWLLRLFINNGFVDSLAEDLCGVVSGVLPNTTLFEDFDQEITQDYKVGGNIVTELNSDTSSIPKIAFYGVLDDETMLWRTLHYLLNPPNDEDYFDAVHDSIAVDWANTNRLRYLARTEAWGNCAFLYPYWQAGFLNDDIDTEEEYCDQFSLPSNCLVPPPQMGEIAQAWAKGYEWWLTANDRYRLIFGALELETVPTQECWCHSCNTLSHGGNCLYFNEWYPLPQGEPCESVYIGDQFLQEVLVCELRTFQNVSKISKEADGAILAESAMAYPDGFGGFAPFERMLGSGHQQMRNDGNTKLKLTRVFNGDIVPWFFTPIK